MTVFLFVSVDDKGMSSHGGKDFNLLGSNSFYLIHKAPITTAAEDIHKFFSLFFRENKT